LSFFLCPLVIPSVSSCCSASVPLPFFLCPPAVLSAGFLQDSYKCCCRIRTRFLQAFFFWGSYKLLMGSYRIFAQFL
jgi:hypothetical protein